MRRLSTILVLSLLLSFGCYAESEVQIINDVWDSIGNALRSAPPTTNPTANGGQISTANSTSTPLGAGAMFTGSPEDITNIGYIVVTVYADVASATDGLDIQFSPDGVNFDGGDQYTIPLDRQKTFSFQAATQYFRVVYTNGATPQSVFRLQTILKGVAVKDSSHRIQDSINTDDDAVLSKSVLTGEVPANGFVNIAATIDGALSVSEQASGLNIAAGQVTGRTFVHKFGAAPDISTAVGEATIWDGSETTGLAQYDYPYSTTADIDRISSDNAGDAQNIEVQGLDTNLEVAVQTIALTGQTPVSLTTPLKRVFRVKNVSSTDLAGDVYCFVNTATSGGIPTDTTKARAQIHAENNQTEMAIYTCPADKMCYLESWYAATSGSSRDSNYIIRLYARPPGQVFQLKHRHAISDTASNSHQHFYSNPEVFAAGTDIEMTVEMTATGATGAAVSAGFEIVLIDN